MEHGFLDIKLKQPQSAAKRVVMNTGILYAKMGITMFISLYTTRLILNSLGASDFGIFNIVGGAIAMLGFLNVAMAGATQRFMSYAEGEGNRDKQKNIFNISVVLHFGIAVLLGIVLLGAGYFFFNGILNIPEERMYAARMIYYFMIVSTMFTVMTVPYDAVLNAHENMLYYAIVGIIESVLKLAVALVVVYTLSDKLIVYGALMAGISLLVMIIMRVYFHKKYEECVFHPRRYYDKALMKEMSGFAGWNFIGQASTIFVNYGYGIILNRFFGTILNASLGIVGQLNGQLLSFSNSMMKAVNPVIVKAEGSGNRENMFRTTFTACKLSFSLYAIFAIPFLIESSYILRLWLKNVPPYVEIFFRICIIQILIEQISIPLGTALSAVGKIKQYNIVTAIIMISSMVIVFLLFKIGLPPYSLFLVSLCSALIIMLFKVAFCKKYGGMSVKSYFTRVIFRCFIIISLVFIVAISISVSMSESFIRLVTVTGISFLIFGTLFYYIVSSYEEKQLLRQILTKK
jgi:O-antigen/teichoic acid export membrane protein